jgi:hypothetical protein
MPKRVLVADDDPMIRKILCRMFEEQARYEVCAEAAILVYRIADARRCQQIYDVFK